MTKIKPWLCPQSTPCRGEQRPSVETKIIVTKQHKYIWQNKNQILFLLCPWPAQCVSKFILSQMFPRRSFKATIIFRLEWLPRLAELQWFMSLVETTTSIFWARHPNLNNYRLFIDSVQAYSDIMFLDIIKKSSFSEVLKMRMKLIILGFYTRQ